MVNVLINNIEVLVQPNTSVLKACEIAGFEIPRFCYHKRLSVAGNCRMCLVEVEKSPKPVVACAMPVMSGMVIFTDTPLVKKARENVLEFLLENHPLDCPICDQGGECDLQDQALAFGSDKTRFYDFKRGVLDKNLGPLVKTIMTRCIHCTRCVRFGEEIAGIEDLGTTIRGTKTEIGTYLEKIFNTELSGNVIDLCPVGALTSKPYAFTARPWELKTEFIVDITDGLGNKIKVDLKDNKIVRVSPFYLTKSKAEDTANLKENIFNNTHSSSHGLLRLKTLDSFGFNYINTPSKPSFRDFWISDKTRFSYEGLASQFTTYIALKRVNMSLNSSLITTKTYHTDLEKLSNKDKKFLIDSNTALNIITKPNFFLNLIKENLFFKTSDTKSTFLNIICGYTTDMETLQSAKYLVNCLNNKAMENICSIMTSRNFYLTNPNEESLNSFKTSASIEELEKIDLCLLIGVNPRYDASVYNLHLRKRYLQGGFTIASIGSPVNLTYPVTHLGNNMQILSELILGKHSFIEKIKSASKPIILLGSNLLESKDYFKIEELVSLFVAQYNLDMDRVLNSTRNSISQEYSKNDFTFWNIFNQDYLRYGVLQTQANQLGSLSLGIPGLNSSVVDFQSNSVIYLLNVDPKEIQNILKKVAFSCFNGKLPTVIIQGPRFNFDSSLMNNIDFIIPTKSHLEKEKASFLNTEGFLSTTKGIINTSTDKKILSDVEVLTKIMPIFFSYYSTKKKKEYEKQSFFSFSFSSSFDNRKKINMIRLLDTTGSFNDPFNNKKRLWSSSIEDFYSNDGISLASPIMGKCSILHRSKRNTKYFKKSSF
jgi:NADH dehydrogenase/NADH:ubiquinone oxidoreductase subunit G